MCSEIGNLICLKHLFRSTTVANFKLFWHKKNKFQVGQLLVGEAGHKFTKLLNYALPRSMELLKICNCWKMSNHNNLSFFFVLVVLEISFLASLIEYKCVYFYNHYDITHISIRQACLRTM